MLDFVCNVTTLTASLTGWKDAEVVRTSRVFKLRKEACQDYIELDLPCYIALAFAGLR